MKNSKGLLFFYDWREPFEELTGDECKTLLLAMLDYSREGTPPPEFKGGAKIAASFIFPAIERSKERAESGSKGGSSRKGGEADSKLNASCAQADGELPSSETQPQDKDKTKTKTKTKTQTLTHPAEDGDTERERQTREFEQFWSVYPKQCGKSDALSEWISAGITSEQLPDILKAVKAQAASAGWCEDNRRYVPLPVNYIRGKRWEDAVIPVESDNGGSFDTDEFVKAALAKSSRDCA